MSCYANLVALPEGIITEPQGFGVSISHGWLVRRVETKVDRSRLQGVVHIQKRIR